MIFSSEEQVHIAVHIIETCNRHQIATCALNVLPDHVHLVLAAEDASELTRHIQKIKGYSAYAFHKGQSDDGIADNGLKPVVEKDKSVALNNGLQPIAQSSSHPPVWAQKFHYTVITSPSQLEATLHYVRTNHEKHAERWGEALLDTWNKGLQPLVERACVSPEQAANGK